MPIGKRHKKSNDGKTGSIVYARPAIPKTLENEYLASRAAEAAARHTKEAQKKNSKSTLDPLMVLQARALKEYEGWTRRQLAAFFAWPMWKVDQVCNYYQLAHVVPKPEDAPADKVKPVIVDGRFRSGRRKPDEAELRLGAQD